MRHVFSILTLGARLSSKNGLASHLTRSLRVLRCLPHTPSSSTTKPSPAFHASLERVLHIFFYAYIVLSCSSLCNSRNFENISHSCCFHQLCLFFRFSASFQTLITICYKPIKKQCNSWRTFPFRIRSTTLTLTSQAHIARFPFLWIFLSSP